MEKLHFQGNLSKYTGVCEIKYGQAFYQIKILSGNLKGKIRYTPIPDSVHILKWGENLSQDQIKRMKSGEIFILLDEKGYLYSNVTKDYYGKTRERKIEGKIYCSNN